MAACGHAFSEDHRQAAFNSHESCFINHQIGLVPSFHMNAIFTVKKSVFFEFTCIFLLLIIIRGAFVFSISLNGDDLLFSYSSFDTLLSEHAMQLRIISAFATWVARFLGGLVPFQTSFWRASVLASMAIFSLALRHYWAPKSSTFLR